MAGTGSSGARWSYCGARQYRPACLGLLLLRLAAASTDSDGASIPRDLCGGLKVYVYADLPSGFPNATGTTMLEVLAKGAPTPEDPIDFGGVPCAYEGGLCKYMQNGGLGQPYGPRFSPRKLLDSGIVFHQTSQNSLPWLFASHVLGLCSVSDPEDAQLFYVPYSVDAWWRVSRAGHATREQIDANYAAVKAYLAEQPVWKRCNGCDHVMAIAKPIQMFRKRWAEQMGGYYHEDPFWARVTRLTHHVGALRGGPNEIGAFQGPVAYDVPVVCMPWASEFAMKTDAQVQRWLEYVQVDQSARDPRAVLVAGPRPHRVRLFEVCAASPDACVYQAFPSPHHLYFEHYRNYTFAIHPGGDTPTRRGFFDTLMSGTIPIVFSEEAAVAGKANFVKEDPSHHYRLAYSAFFHGQGWGDRWLDQVALVARDEETAMRMIMNISAERIAELQRNIRRVLPSLLYASPETLRGAPDAVQRSTYLRRGAIPTALRMLARSLSEERYPAADAAWNRPPAQDDSR